MKIFTISLRIFSWASLVLMSCHSSKKSKEIGAGYEIIDTNVYHSGKILEGADFKTFEFIKYGYCRDKNAFYNAGLKIKGADPETFMIFDPTVSMAKNFVYRCSDNDSVEPVSYVDRKTFERICDTYYRDVNYLYGVTIDTLKNIRSLTDSEIKEWTDCQ